jgi:hypothetical protein
MRGAVIRTTLRVIERILAQGDCSDAELAAFQQLVEEAERIPVFATMMRGDRGMNHYFFSSLASGDVPHPSILGARGVNDHSQLPGVKDIRRIHAWLLLYATEGVAIANQLPERWAELLAPHDEKRSSAPLAGHPLVEAVVNDYLNRGEGKRSFASAHAAAAKLQLAELRSAMTALAVERYRLARGEWPRDLAALVPTYLKDVPNDPYDGRPLRYRPTADGVVIYCVGSDQADNQGKRSSGYTLTDGQDVGFQLWDPASERKPKPVLPRGRRGQGVPGADVGNSGSRIDPSRDTDRRN